MIRVARLVPLGRCFSSSLAVPISITDNIPAGPRDLPIGKAIEVSAHLPSGRAIHFAVGRLARLADGAATVTIGGSLALGTVVSSRAQTTTTHIPPYTFTHRRATFSSSGTSLLVASLVEASLRPLFPYGYMYGTGVQTVVHSADGDLDEEVLAINAASAALCVSDVPFDGPVGCVRVVTTAQGEVVVNPTARQRATARLDVLYAGARAGAVMVRARAASPTPYQEVCLALERCEREVEALLFAQMDLGLAGGKQPRPCVILAPNKDCAMTTRLLTGAGYAKIFSKPDMHKEDRLAAMAEVELVCSQGLRRHYANLSEYDVGESAFLAKYDTFRNHVLEGRKRVDGRAFRESQTIYAERDPLPSGPKSALFQRGDTQALCVLHPAATTTTTTTTSSSVESDSLSARESQTRWFAEAACSPLTPAGTRLDIDVLCSDGSRDAVAACAGAVAVAQPGVEAISAVTIGALSTVLVGSQAVKQCHLLTDTTEMEETLGDMKLSVAGTPSGLTALSLDSILPSVPVPVLCDAVLEAAPTLRAHSQFIRDLVDRMDKGGAKSSVQKPMIPADNDFPAKKRPEVIKA